MARSVCHVARPQDSGLRLDRLIAEQGIYKSRSAAEKAILSGKVLVGGQRVSKSYAVCPGDAVVCELEEGEAPGFLQGEPIELDIKYEDEDLLVISKPAGMLTHPSADHTSGTLVNALIHHCGAGNLCNVQGEDDRPGIVHRLDGDTSGLMLAAKTDVSGSALMDAIRLREVDRRYIALVHGIIRADSATVDAPIARHPKDRKRMAVMDTPNARDAITTLKVLARYSGTNIDNGYTLVECKLFTGRTHQIRVHMQYANHPVVGDATYTKSAPKDPKASIGLDRQFLHSYKIGFQHPTNGNRLEFTDSLPSDLLYSLDVIKDRLIEITDEGKQVFHDIGIEEYGGSIDG